MPFCFCVCHKRSHVTPAERKPFYGKANHLRPEKALSHCVSDRVQERERLSCRICVVLYLHITWVYLLDAAVMNTFSLKVDPSDCSGLWFSRGRHAYWAILCDFPKIATLDGTWHWSFLHLTAFCAAVVMVLRNQSVVLFCFCFVCVCWGVVSTLKFKM